MLSPRIKELLVKKYSGEISLAEQLELSKILNADTESKEICKYIEDTFHSKLSFTQIDAATEKNSFSKLSQKIHSKKISQRRWFRYVSTAASIILISGVAFYIFNFFQPERGTIEKKQSHTVTTKKGSRSKLVLPDGSEVWLNADSKVSYDETFGKDKREITLTGEAFFDVVKDADRPFIIYTPILEIKVLGTAFNVRAYSEEKNVQTSLIRGSVEVTVKNIDNKTITMKPNEKLVVKIPQEDNRTIPIDNKNNQEKNIILSKLNAIGKDSVYAETEWINNRIAFNHEKLENIALQLERWYGVEIVITDNKLKNLNFSGVFEDENAEQIIEALHYAGNFEYVVVKKTIIIGTK